MNLQEYLKDEGIRQRLMARMQTEYAATCTANFAMSEIGMLLEQEVAATRQREAELVEKTTADRETIRVLRAEIDELKQKLGEPVALSRRRHAADEAKAN